MNARSARNTAPERALAASGQRGRASKIATRAVNLAASEDPLALHLRALGDARDDAATTPDEAIVGAPAPPTRLPLERLLASIDKGRGIRLLVVAIPGEGSVRLEAIDHRDRVIASIRLGKRPTRELANVLSLHAEGIRLRRNVRHRKGDFLDLEDDSRSALERTTNGAPPAPGDHA